ncbi:hypothetical protein [Labrys monachus]|uniref:Uncharacterized protein n=1 Tax=Labrys monachus TaxID=217067 RepID=A0ABU0FBJ1_9HYPH|nr:hypothetical protein [Labrys monachus]MDQ0391801.1 hypothetical protein [Labrys monachus]
MSSLADILTAFFSWLAGAVQGAMAVMLKDEDAESQQNAAALERERQLHALPDADLLDRMHDTNAQLRAIRSRDSDCPRDYVPIPAEP